MSKLTELERLLTDGKITRRDFIARVSALGLMAAVSPALLSKPAKAAAPKKGGRLKIGITGGSTTDSMDPATLTSNMNQNVNWQIRNCLVEIDHNFNTIPELAESWGSTPDAKVWTFKLRKGVEFHNGKTMTAEDVVFSINHHLGEESKSAAKGYLKSVQNIKADGKYEVIFELSGGSADFPFILGSSLFPVIGISFSERSDTGFPSFKNIPPGTDTLFKFWACSSGGTNG